MAKQEPSSLTADWPLALVRSAARDTLAQDIYTAHCAYTRTRGDWHALTVERRAMLRALASEILSKVDA